MTMTEQGLDLTEAGFRRWLSDWEPEAVVGFAGVPNASPLACWIGSQGFTAVDVGTAAVWLTVPQPRGRAPQKVTRTLPGWAWKFQQALPAGDGKPVTAALALTVLDGLTPEK